MNRVITMPDGGYKTPPRRRQTPLRGGGGKAAAAAQFRSAVFAAGVIHDFRRDLLRGGGPQSLLDAASAELKRLLLLQQGL